MTTRITFNGMDYDGLDAMPPDVRQEYDRLMLAFKQTGPGLKRGVNFKFATKVRFVHDGKAYKSLEEMPADVRAKYQSAMGQLDKNRNGVPDFLEGESLPAPSMDSTLPIAASAALSASSQRPVIAPESSASRLLVLAGALIPLLVVVVAGLVIYIISH